MKERWLKNKKIYVLFLVLVFLFYGNSLKNKYSLDDDYITVTNFPVKGQPYTPNNYLVKDGFKSIPKIWLSRYAHDSESSFDYRPVVTTSFAIEYAIFGQTPFVSHLINILLYLIVIILLFDVLLVLFQDNPNRTPIAFIASLIFLIHPLHTEVVDSLKCRDELLATLFSLIAIKYAFSFILKPNLKHALLISLFLFLAFFSKLSAVLLMTSIPLILFFYRRSQYKKTILVTFFLFMLYHLFQSFMNLMPEEELKRVFYRFENPLFTENFSLIDKIFIAIKTFGFYIQMLAFPYPLRFYYGANMFDFSNAVNGHSLFSVVFVILSCFFYWRTKNKDFLFGFVLLVLLMFPFLNILTPVAGILGERLMFIPSIAFCILVAVIINPLFIKFDYTGPSQFFAKPLSYLSVIILAAMVYTINRNTDWYNKLTLFENDIPHLTKSSKANSLIANEYFEMIRNQDFKQNPQILVQKCIKYYSQAVTNDSSFFSAYNNAGVVYYSYLKDYSRAKKLFTLAIRHKPLYAQAYENLGNCYKKESNISMAFECYKKSISIKPNEISSHLSIINLFFDVKDFNKCLKCIGISKTIFPNNYEIIVQEANCYLMKENIPKAISSFELAYKIFPNKNLAKYISAQALKIGNLELSKKYDNL